MTPLSDALTAVQRRRLAELERSYVAEEITPDELMDGMEEVGVTDTVHLAFLLTSLSVLRAWGVGEPSMAASMYLVDRERDSEATRA